MEKIRDMGKRKFLLKKRLRFINESLYYTIYSGFFYMYTLFSNKSRFY